MEEKSRKMKNELRGWRGGTGDLGREKEYRNQGKDRLERSGIGLSDSRKEGGQVLRELMKRRKMERLG